MTRKVVSNTRPIAVFRRIFLLLFFRDSRAGNRCKRTPAFSRIKLKFTEHVQQNAPLFAYIFYKTQLKSQRMFILSHCFLFFVYLCILFIFLHNYSSIMLNSQNYAGIMWTTIQKGLAC